MKTTTILFAVLLVGLIGSIGLAQDEALKKRGVEVPPTAVRRMAEACRGDARRAIHGRSRPFRSPIGPPTAAVPDERWRRGSATIPACPGPFSR